MCELLDFHLSLILCERAFSALFCVRPVRWTSHSTTSQWNAASSGNMVLQVERRRLNAIRTGCIGPILQSSQLLGGPCLVIG